MAVSSKLAKLRKKIAEGSGGGNDHSIFTFWNIPFGGQSILRFLPFDDPISESFWVEKKMVPMSFLDPADDSKIINVQAPCFEMYQTEDLCRVVGHVRALYKEVEELKNAGDTTNSKRIAKVASAHWIKPLFYYQGFVIKPGFAEENTPENPIRIFPMVKQVHTVIKASLSDETINFEGLPTGEFEVDEIKALMSDEDLEESVQEEILQSTLGHNFVLKKTKQGEHPNWLTSTWMLTSKDLLDDEQLGAVAEHGLHDLRKRLPKQPTEEQYDIYEEMMQISIGRLLGTDDGFWNPEWEEAGIKPMKKRGQASSDDKDQGSSGGSSARKSTGSNLSSRLKKQLNKDDDGQKDTPKSVMDRVNKSRSASTEEATEEVAEEAPVEEAPAQTGTTNAALAARIKNRIGKKSA